MPGVIPWIEMFLFPVNHPVNKHLLKKHLRIMILRGLFWVVFQPFLSPQGQGHLTTWSPHSAFYPGSLGPQNILLRWLESASRACLSPFPECNYWMRDCTKVHAVLCWKTGRGLIVGGGCEVSLGWRQWVSVCMRTRLHAVQEWLGVRRKNRPTAKRFQRNSCHGP